MQSKKIWLEFYPQCQLKACQLNVATENLTKGLLSWTELNVLQPLIVE